ncbi:cytidylyltransferase domain-containing protein [Paenibacillus illinoisensis]|uniref:acylneuraminate cytidylyltransferase family protein n=1 Tax=Paenibacillus illinoisensis TaxID=59845 RepID=UPI003D2688E0
MKKRKSDCLAIIPARGVSKGLPGKNIRLMNGKPMIVYTIEAAFESGCVNEVVVSTDSEEIAKVAREAGASVPFLRPTELASDEAKSIDVLKHAVAYYERELELSFDSILLLQPTSPLRNARDILDAYTEFVCHDADSLQSVTSAQTHPYLLRCIDEHGKLSSYVKAVSHLRRQELEKLYELNGAVYFMKRDLLMEQNQIVGENNLGFIMPKERSIDIDDIWDFRLAEFAMKEFERKDSQKGEEEWQ